MTGSSQEASYVLSEADNREFQKYGIHEIKFVRTAQEVRVEFYAGPSCYQFDDGRYLHYYFYLGQCSINDNSPLRENIVCKEISHGKNHIPLPVLTRSPSHIYIGLKCKGQRSTLETSIPLTSIPSQEKQTILEDRCSSFSGVMHKKNRRLSDSHSLSPSSGAVNRKSTHPYEEKRGFQTNDLKGSSDRLAQNRRWNTGTQLGVSSRDYLLESIQKRLKELENKQGANDDRVQKIERYIENHLYDLENYKEEIRHKDTQLISQINHDRNKLQKEIRDEAQLNIKNADRISSLESQIGQFPTISQLRNINEVIARHKIEDLRGRICQDCSDLKLTENNLEKGYVEIYDQVSKVIKKIPSLLHTPLPEGGREWEVASENLDKEFTTIKRRKEGPIDVIQELEDINLQDFHDNGSSYSEDIKATFLSQSWTPSNPIQSYQNKLDKYLEKIYTKYLQDREKSLSQLFKTSDEFRDALEKFVVEKVFPFTETPLNEIKKWRQGQEPEKSRGYYNDQFFNTVRSDILRRAGIEEFSIKIGTSFDEAVHDRVRDQMDTRHKNNVVLETDTPGYRLNWGTRKVIRKARVIINHNP